MATNVNAAILDLETKKVLNGLVVDRTAAIAAATIDVSGLTATVNALHGTVLADLTAIAASLNQLIIDYNANANIITDTTATSVTLTTT